MLDDDRIARAALGWFVEPSASTPPHCKQRWPPEDSR
jgi:hypothetical protein